MSIIVNGVTIPTSGDYIKVGSTLIDKVDVVKNGVRTTVWERLKDWKAADKDGWYGDAASTWSVSYDSHVVSEFQKTTAGCKGKAINSDYYSSSNGYSSEEKFNHGMQINSGWIPTLGCSKLKVVAVCKMLSSTDFTDCIKLTINGNISGNLYSYSDKTYEFRDYQTQTRTVEIDISLESEIQIIWFASSNMDDSRGKGTAELYFDEITFKSN